MADRENEKRIAAEASLDFVENGMTLGLGTGSTAAYMIELLGQRVRAGLSVRCVATSKATESLAKRTGIPLTDLESCPRLDLTIDGADEVDGRLSLIKGGGGALLAEKIVASASDRMIVIADSGKRVEVLGAFPLPVEVVPFGWTATAAHLEKLGVNPRLRRLPSGDPFLSDHGHYILDCPFGHIPRPCDLAQSLAALPGVVEHGLFIALCDIALIGSGSRVEKLRRVSD